MHTRFYYYINLILLFFLIYLLLNYEDNEIYDVFYQKNEVFQAKVIIMGTRTDCENHLILKEKEIEIQRVQTRGRFNKDLEESWEIPLQILDKRMFESTEYN